MIISSTSSSIQDSKETQKKICRDREEGTDSHHGMDPLVAGLSIDAHHSTPWTSEYGAKKPTVVYTHHQQTQRDKHKI